MYQRCGLDCSVHLLYNCSISKHYFLNEAYFLLSFISKHLMVIRVTKQQRNVWYQRFSLVLMKLIEVYATEAAVTFYAIDYFILTIDALNSKLLIFFFGVRLRLFINLTRLRRIVDVLHKLILLWLWLNLVFFLVVYTIRVDAFLEVLFYNLFWSRWIIKIFGATEVLLSSMMADDLVTFFWNTFAFFFREVSGGHTFVFIIQLFRLTTVSSWN